MAVLLMCCGCAETFMWLCLSYHGAVVCRIFPLKCCTSEHSSARIWQGLRYDFTGNTRRRAEVQVLLYRSGRNASAFYAAITEVLELLCSNAGTKGAVMEQYRKYIGS